MGIGVHIPAVPLAGPGTFIATGQASLQPDEHRAACTESSEPHSQQLTESSGTSPLLLLVPPFHIWGDRGSGRRRTFPRLM